MKTKPTLTTLQLQYIVINRMQLDGHTGTAAALLAMLKKQTNRP